MFRFVSRLLLVALCSMSGVATAADSAYLVQPGDVLSIVVWKEPSLQGPVLVRPDGGFSFQLVGEVNARGKSVAELQQVVRAQLGKYIADPVVTITVQDVKGNKVYVIGQVTRPGEFVMNPNVDVMQALSMAGGVTPYAALNNILILRRGGTGQVSLPFRYSEVIKGKNLDENIMLQSGDVVVVP